MVEDKEQPVAKEATKAPSIDVTYEEINEVLTDQVSSLNGQLVIANLRIQRLLKLVAHLQSQ